MKNSKIIKAGNYLTTAYLILMFCVYPFYMEKGYTNIGEAKNHFFQRVSMASFLVLAVVFVIQMFGKIWERRKQKEAYLVDWSKVSYRDLFLLLFSTMIFLSYAFSPYKAETLWGTEGWYMGCIPLLLLCGLAFFISRMWNGEKVLFYGIIFTSGLVFLLGICNRFSFYPIEIEASQPGFISTLGNINWFSGYLSVVAPAGICLFVFDEGKKWIFAVYAVLAFMAGFCQGSSSIFLWFGAVFFLLLWIAAEKRKWLENWLFLGFLWGISAQLVRMLRCLLPEKYNYDVDNLCGYFTDSGLTLWIATAAAVSFFLLRMQDLQAKKVKLQEQQEKAGKKVKIIHRIMAGSLLTVTGLWLMLSIINTCTGVFGLTQNQLFLFDQSWGNGRGAAIKAGWTMFREMPLLHKFIGVGPDGFCSYAYSLQEVAVLLRDEFGSSRLTNAHLELLTCLVNEGILGTLFYIGTFASLFWSCIRKGKGQPLFYIAAVSVGCYFVHNMVSFAQVLNIPFLFMIWGMGESMLRKENRLSK